MSITKDDLIPLIYDPNRILKLLLDSTGTYEIKEPTNPFVMLLEASGVLASASATESISILKKLYPSLATETGDLIHHVNDEELINIFSYPAEANIVFYINVKELKTYGIYNEQYKYREVILPYETVVNITNIPFTLLNDIRIKLYDSGVVFVEQLTSQDELANNSLGVLPSGIVNFQNGEPWIAFETTLKQVKKHIINKPVTVSEGFKQIILHNDRYYYSNVYYKNNNTNNEWVKLNKSHTDDYIDPYNPTVFITVNDGELIFKIPDTYLLSGQVSGEVKIELYETKGRLTLPIYKYSMEDFEVSIEINTSNPAVAAIKTMSVFANSRDTVDGGKNGLSFEELKDSIINNALGKLSLPITDKQLSKRADELGFKLFNAIDIVTDRVYIATRNIDRLESDVIYCKPDIYFNTVNLELNVINNSKIIANDEFIMIPSNTIFKEDNGIIRLLNDTELLELNTTNNAQLVRYLNRNKLFFNPYYYIIKTDDTRQIESRVYDLDKPNLDNIKILGKNINLIERANIGQYGIVKTDTGYKIMMTILKNKEFDNIDISLLRGQLSIPLLDGDVYIHFEGVYDPTTELLTFDINTDFNITEDDQIKLTGGISEITNTLTDLKTKANIYLFTTDPGLTDETNYLVSEIKLNYSNIKVFDKESIDIEFGRRIEYIWNKLFITYNDRKYLRYTTDKPKVYKEDVYEPDPETGSIIRVVTNEDGTKTTTKVLLHAKGDPVLDEEGNIIYEHRKGDIVLDENGLPVIDKIGGIVRHIDIMMLDYEFKIANSTIYENYLDTIKDILRTWLFNNLKELNDITLENTKILYKSYKSAEPVKIKTGSIETSVPYIVKPHVTLYCTRDDYTKLEINNIKTAIGYILHEHLDKTEINLNEIKNEITTKIDSSIISAKIDNFDVYSNNEAFKVVDPTRRLSMAKTITINNNNERIVEYDLELKIHKI